MKRATASDPAKTKEARQLAAEILLKVETRDAYADLLLDHSLRAFSLSPLDRALLTELVYGTLRWRGKIDWYLQPRLRQPISSMDGYLRNLLRLTLYQLLFLDKIPNYAAVNEGVKLAKNYGGSKAGGLVNAVLRRILREKNQLSLPDRERDPIGYLSVAYSHPDWLVRKWLRELATEDMEALLAANNKEAPLTLRANRLKEGRDAICERLHERGLDARPTAWSPQGIRVKSGSAVDRLPGFEEGLFQVQGEASQLVGCLLDPRPGERVLDGCAAPGGKATHLAELMQDKGEIVAADVSVRGVQKIQENMRRLSLTSIHPVVADITEGLTGALALPYDRILVDAPCSGLGTLRSHPEAKWRRSEQDIQRLARLQKKMIKRIASYLKPGGVLVYATCTLSHEENENVVEEFLDEEKAFVLEEAAGHLPSEARKMIRGNYFFALPHKHDTDGFFAARMRKVE